MARRGPDLGNINGSISAWKLPVTQPAHAATLEYWLVEGPFHPAWNQWCVGVCHLRAIPGVDPAYKQYPAAEYEFIIFSCDPGFPVDVDDPRPRALLPIDCAVQFHGCTDEQAKEVCRLAVTAIVHGHASPDQDFRKYWEHAIPFTLEHLVLGAHPAPIPQ